MKSLYKTLQAARKDIGAEHFDKIMQDMVQGLAKPQENLGCTPPCQPGYICSGSQCIRDIDLTTYAK